MEDNLNIIQQIMLQVIKLDQTQSGSFEFEYHSNSKKLNISVCTDTNPTFNDGLTRRWWISVKNTELLKVVLEELKKLEIATPENQIDDFLG
ncbi:hypothetical protein [Clostridium scatologenes]|uniref:Uncharacterized protein n=1 Tax=Clostridium scatologenes TaxID=1548 RepID=A0A0E3JY12_CLOSL|nr:hypothetical protein [Clostridium scatologenes]AKA68505.1 hypothetical protein CSCA_1380 [Clostridium scatologenes]